MVEFATTMAYMQTPITIEKALAGIQAEEYILPAIQREFVWKPAQVSSLFDSLMRGYPIGSFLFWKLAPETLAQFVFYKFIREFHQLKAPHCPQYEGGSHSGVTAILDGQQRLTALNIGLRGTHAEKAPYKWSTNIDAYPVKFLFLDLKGKLEETDLQLMYDFKFLSGPEGAESSSQHHWFRVSQILELDAGNDLFDYVREQELMDTQAFKVLHRLHAVVRSEPVIGYFLEEEQSIDKVLNIFIRVNSGGSVLSHSDLLLSIATAQWKTRDAREDVYGLVDTLNGTRYDFSFSKDLVLKAGLVLTEQPDIGFKVSNFNLASMQRLEDDWDEVARALAIGSELLGRFGFTGRTLAADSVLIPIAYYLHQINADPGFLDAAAAGAGRAQLRDWVIRSLIKRGIWGSALDTLLAALRQAIRESDPTGKFPVEAAEAAMLRLGKNLRFTAEEVEDLGSTPYPDRRVFCILTLLYPGVDVRNVFHIDHVFPAALFARRRLLKAGVPEANVREFSDMANRLPNLQLLEGPLNIQKQAMLPLDWAIEQFPDPQARGMYLAGHDMHDLPPNLVQFGDFYNSRAERMAGRLMVLLDIDSAGPM